MKGLLFKDLALAQAFIIIFILSLSQLSIFAVYHLRIRLYRFMLHVKFGGVFQTVILAWIINPICRIEFSGV